MGKGSSDGGSKALGQIAQQINRETTPNRRLFLGQMETALRTGGIPQALIPSVQRAAESQSRAFGGALSDFDDRAAAAGIGEDSFTQAARSGLVAQGTAEGAGIPTAITNQLLQTAPNFLLGQSTNAQQALSAQAGNETAAKGNSTQAIVGVLSAAATAYCWLAEAAFPLFDPRVVRGMRRVHAAHARGALWARAYARYGQRLASWLRRHPRALPLARLALQPIVR